MEGAATGPGTVRCCARGSQGSGLGAGVSDGMICRGTRSSGPQQVPIKAPGSKSVTPANGMNWRPFFTTCSSEEKISAACSMSTR